MKSIDAYKSNGIRTLNSMWEIVLDWQNIVITTIIALIIAKKYSTSYHIKGKNLGKEKYIVLEKLKLGLDKENIHYARVILEKSSVKNAMGFMDIAIKDTPEDIKIINYAFLHSWIHEIIAPGKTLMKKETTWDESLSSNEFSYIIKSKKSNNDLTSIPSGSTFIRLKDIIYSRFGLGSPIIYIPRKLKRKCTECVEIESYFEYPKNYSGPEYNPYFAPLVQPVVIFAFSAQQSQNCSLRWT